MNDLLYRLAKKIRPDLERLNGQQRISGTADVLTLLYMLPLAVVGLFWLVSVSNWESIRHYWQIYLIMAVILLAFNRLRFFFITEIRSGGYANSDGTLDGIGVWAAILLLGPTALWLKVILDLLTFSGSAFRERSIPEYWNRSRLLTTDVAIDTLPTLVALVVYLWVGGTIPIKDFSIVSIAPAFIGVIIQYIGTFVIYSGYIIYVLWSLKNVLHIPLRPAISFFFIAVTLPALANPFGILAAGIFAREGFLEFLFIMIGLILTALLARRLSQAAEYSRQQSNQLEQLEKLGRAFLEAPPDASKLAEVLQQHVTSMFASRGLLIWSESKGILIHEPPTLAFDLEMAWKWLQKNNSVSVSMARKKIDWNQGILYHGPTILCPINDVKSGLPIGGIFIEIQTMNIPWDPSSVRRQLPAVQSLAAQIASAINQANTYTETIAMERTMQELSLARTIQASFLPETIPDIPGWQLSATLEPARQVAGDFYDFIKLPNGKLGILIADVADKGLGAALYMALSSTLIRIFASEYPTEPALVLKAANQHILSNARANLFVTVFLGVLDPSTGTLAYANAGHNPPYIFGADRGVNILSNTGMPLGIDDDNTWYQDEVTISPGEMLLLYTDGVTDAQNDEGEFIDRKMITSVAQQNINKSTQDVLTSIMDRLHRFVGDAPRFDDITLVILGRKNGSK
jgi:serine phosphatase RsbU (regulator of sigma subunit)